MKPRLACDVNTSMTYLCYVMRRQALGAGQMCLNLPPASNRRLAVRRREAVPPMARVRHPDALDPMNLLSAGGAIQDEIAEAPFQFGLRLE